MAYPSIKIYHFDESHPKSAELKARQIALDKALKEATEAREAKAAMTGELKALKSHNEQLAALLAGKKEPEELGTSFAQAYKILKML